MRHLGGWGQGGGVEGLYRMQLLRERASGVTESSPEVDFGQGSIGVDVI